MTPQQEERFNHANRLYQEGRAKDARPLLEDLYDEVDASEVNHVLVATLYELKQYSQAFRIANEQAATFYESDNLSRLYVEVALKNQSYILARQFIAKRDGDGEELLQLVDQAEEAARKSMPTTIKQGVKDFYHLGDGSLNDQQARFNDAYQLPLKEYLQGARFILRDPYANYLVKASILQVLMELQVKEELTILWIDDHEYPVTPARLVLPTTEPVVREVDGYIAAKYGNSDPMTYQMLINEFHLQATFLYPFVNRTITDPGAWFAVLDPNQDEGDSTSISQARGWQQRIERLINDLL